MRLLPKADVDIFGSSDALKKAVTEATAEWQLSRLNISYEDGVVETATEKYAEMTSPALVVIEVAGETSDLLDAIERLAQTCDPGTRAIIIGHQNDINLYRDLTALGVSDYLVPPFTKELIVDALERALGEDNPSLDHKLVAVVSGKGGVGVTSVAQQIAWLLTDRVKDQTLLLDLCGAVGTAGIALGVQTKRSLDGLLTNIDQLDEGLIRSTAMSVRDQLDVLSGGDGTLPADAFAEGEIEQLLDVSLAAYPLVIADLPTGWGSLARDIALRAASIIVVSEPTLPSLRNTRFLLENLKEHRKDAPVKLVINRAGLYGKAEVGKNAIEETLGLTPAAFLPFDPAAFASIEMDGKSFDHNKQAHKILKLLENVAFDISGTVEAQVPKKRKWKFIGF